MKENKIIYNTINHGLRNTLKLNNNEYILLDSIYQLQQQTGWCYASKEYLTQIVDIKERALKDVIDNLIKKCYILRKDDTNRYLKVTDKWIIPFNGNVAETAGENQQKLQENQQKLPTEPAETADYNNNIIIDINNNNKKSILNLLYKINKRIYLLGQTKSQLPYWEELLKGDNNATENNIKIIQWYVEEYIKREAKGGDDFKYFPKAIIPSQLVEKWDNIERLYKETNKEFKPLW